MGPDCTDPDKCGGKVYGGEESHTVDNNEGEKSKVFYYLWKETLKSIAFQSDPSITDIE